MSAQPAHPLLASTLFDLHNAKLARHQSNATNQITTDERLPSRKWRKLETGWKSIDGEVLQGGLAYGEGGIVCLSAGGSGANGGDGGVGELGDQLAYSVLASHLLSTASSSTSHSSPPSDPATTPSTPQNPAYYIDTLGTFSPHRLHNLLCTRLRQPDFTHQGGYVYHKVNGLVGMTRTGPAGMIGPHDEGGKHHGNEQAEEEESVEAKAAKLLDRVRIMRCFDFKGLMECIGEIGTELRELDRKWEKGDGGTERGKTDPAAAGEAIKKEQQVGNDVTDGASLAQEHQDQAKMTSPKAQKLEILDSQADDFDFDDDDDDDGDGLLLDEYLVNTTSTNTNTNTTTVDHPPPAPPPPNTITTIPHHHPPQTLLILPSLPRLLSPLMHSNHIRGHALLTHLLRSLRHLTSSHALCALILNSVVGMQQSYPNNTNNTYAKSNGGGDEGVTSVFGENGALRPALGKTFAWGVDLGLMGSFVGSGGGGGKERVLEVVSDRFGGRVGWWGVV